MPADLCPCCRRLTDVCCLLSCDLPTQIDEKNEGRASDAELESRGGRRRLQRANEASQLRSSATNRPPQPCGALSTLYAKWLPFVCAFAIQKSHVRHGTMRRRLDLGPDRS